MSIIIQNITEARKVGEYGKGNQLYQLRINSKVIAEFVHNFGDGLGECLRKAGTAAENPNRLERQNERSFLEACIQATVRK